MKKIIILVAVASLVAFIGCNKKTQPKPSGNVVTVTVDTTIKFPEKNVLTAPRYDCSGRKLALPKLAGVRIDTLEKKIRFSKTVVCGDTTISKSSARVAGASTSEGIPQWLKDLFWILLALLLIALALWLLWLLFINWPERRRVTENRVSQHTANVPGTTPVIPAFEPGKESSFSTEDTGAGEKSNGNTGYEGVIMLVRELRRSGGNVQWGDLYIDIPPYGSNVNVYIDNTDGNISGKVGVNVSNIEVDAPETHYHKTTGGVKNDDQKKTDQEK